MRVTRGFTLIEVLIAIMLFVLMAALALSVYQTFSSNLRRQQAWRERGVPAVAAMEALRRDLACAVEPSGISEPALTVAGEALGGVTQALLICYSVVPAPVAEDPDRVNVERVNYRVQAAPGQDSNACSLVREARVLEGREATGSLVVESVVRGVIRFQLEAWGRGDWVERWPQGTNGGLPPAVHAILTFEEGGQPRRLETEAWIASGQVLGSGAAGRAPTAPPRATPLPAAPRTGATQTD